MEDKKQAAGIDRRDLEFIQEISEMTLHRKILLHGMLIGLSAAEQKTEKDINESEHCY